jgi:hypothetical protein
MRNNCLVENDGATDDNWKIRKKYYFHLGFLDEEFGIGCMAT